MSLAIEQGKDDPAVQTVKDPVQDVWGQTTTLWGAVPIIWYSAQGRALYGKKTACKCA